MANGAMSNITTERIECVRLLRIQDPDASYPELADRLERWRPDLMSGSRSRRARAEMVSRVVALIGEQQDASIAVPMAEAEQARNTFVRRMEEVFVQAMREGDWSNARAAARDVAKACGADIERPIRIEAAHAMTDLSMVPQERLAAFVAELSDDDRRAVTMAFPGVIVAAQGETTADH